MKADPQAILFEAQTLVRARGWEIADEVRAKTDSLYFSAVCPGPGPDGEALFLRVRISAHRAAGWQARARHAFVTCHCIRRARRDLRRLAARIDALNAGDPKGRASIARMPPPA